MIGHCPCFRRHDCVIGLKRRGSTLRPSAPPFFSQHVLEWASSSRIIRLIRFGLVDLRSGDSSLPLPHYPVYEARAAPEFILSSCDGSKFDTWLSRRRGTCFEYHVGSELVSFHPKKKQNPTLTNWDTGCVESC